MNQSLKKQYCKPEIVSVPVDRDISLIMMTSETDPPDPPRGAPPAPSQFEDANFKENPFQEK